MINEKVFTCQKSYKKDHLRPPEHYHYVGTSAECYTKTVEENLTYWLE